MTDREPIVIPEKTSAERIEFPLLDSWKFYRGNTENADTVDFDDSSWETVDIPHTWNSQDGEDGGNDYFRGTGWYRKMIRIDETASGRRIYIEFKGVNSQMELFMNGVFIGAHKGGYTAFRFDITDMVILGGDNLFAVRVSNEADQAIAPLSGDFTFFGGIYREVSLLFVDPVHIDLNVSGSSGVFLTTECVSEQEATLKIASRIINDSADVRNIVFRIVLKHPEHFTQNEFEKKYLTPFLRLRPEDLCGSGTVATRVLSLRIAPGAGTDISETITIDAPHLWNGLADPYRYQIVLSVLEDGVVLDSFTRHIGFRSFSIDKKNGFYLNGKSYPLRGVAIHQDYRGKGNAVTFNEITQSFSFLYEIGANSVRLSHYPHNPYTYELCDKYGITVYAEIPFVNTYGGAGTWEAPDPKLEEFISVTKQQLTELIRQEYNYCAIFCWGLYNEAQKADHQVMVPLVRMLNRIAHELDASRPTVTATFSEEGEVLQSDLLAWNTYPPPGGLQTNAERFYMAMDGTAVSNHLEKYSPFYIQEYDKAGFYDGVLNRPIGISEYGVGGSIDQHTQNYTQGSNTIKIQTEEFQAYCHETWMNQIRQMEYLWGTYVWNLFDFSADNRNEATVPGVNTKGLVTRDRKTRKDAVYLYKAFWRTDLNVLSITGKNNTVRDVSPEYFKIYSNCDAVTLFVDGRECGTLRQEENALHCVFVWPWTEPLAYGPHLIKAIGWKNGTEGISDEMLILRKKRTSTKLRSDILWIDSTKKLISVLPQLTMETLSHCLEGVDGATYMILASGNSISENTEKILPGMQLLVTAEDGETTTLYTFVASDPQKRLRITVPAEEYGHAKTNLTDGDPMTRWACAAEFPAELLLDFGGEMHLSGVSIAWFERRAYRYRIFTSIDGADYTLSADHTGNSAVGTVSSVFQPVSARYVKIEIVGTSDESHWISAYSISVDAWQFHTAYKVDEEMHTICVPYDPEIVISKEEFIDALGLEGNCKAEVITGEAATVYYITNDARLEIKYGDAEYRYRIIYR